MGKITSQKRQKENLKQYGYLNSLTAMIDHVGVQITGFIINPFIVHGLGSTFYGVWQMLTQMTGYANMADTRATQVLKWSVSKKRDIATDEELRSEVMTALVITAFIIPIVLIIGAVIVWYAPFLTNIDEQYYNIIRITCSLLILSLVVHKVFDLFESVLRGMNLGFKRMGFRAGIIAVGGGLKVLAITQGYGLIGLAIVQVLIALSLGFTFYYIVNKTVGWFGFGKTNKEKIKAYGKLSGWFMAFMVTKMMLMNSDKILLGYLIGPDYVTKYTLTLFTAFAIKKIIAAVTDGIIPGIGGKFGKGDYGTVKKARNILITLNWIMVTSFGVTILLLNESFISLWVGKEHYAGTFENLLIMIIAIQYIFFQMDSNIINVTLRLQIKVLLSFLASTATIIAAFLLVKHFEIFGLCISVILGRLILSIGYPLVLKKRLKDNSDAWKLSTWQPMLMTVILLVLATYGSQWMVITNWLNLLMIALVVFPLSGLLIWWVGINSPDRQAVVAVISEIKFFKSH
ncbi:lipopolysaccharide biosynthesis protein [Echinicola jeungdonensis]|uniref:Lipopolysaccharide biosynthesis protein n=1 Tax=Echinicola jeungdonensis TaxID=709343 RepID=A0ABV5J0G7_9BACT|nr:lipopolysaccharide biosynthesis protein [Echinicola jeungdonensis]MDN3671148.1 lipopolysaccharide biosynthesis protein [Echinicola jeungdonensis]